MSLPSVDQSDEYLRDGVYESAKNRFVLGENIAQAAQVRRIGRRANRHYRSLDRGF